jgi:hypothetical protein
MSPTGSRSQAAVAASASATKIPLKYRVKKSFDQIDRDDFRSTAYETFRDFFEKSVKELDGIDDLRARYQSIGPTAFTCTVINGQIKRGRGGEAHITVHASPQAVLGEIYYSFSAHAPANTANGGFSIDVDDYHPFLRPNDFADNNRSRTCPRRRPPAGCGKASSKQADSSQDTQRFLRTADSFTRSRGTIASAHAACSRRNPRSALGSFPRLRS